MAIEAHVPFSQTLISLLNNNKSIVKHHMLFISLKKSNITSQVMVEK